MTSHKALTAEQVSQTVASAKKNNPLYSELLDFYGKLFTLQEVGKGNIHIGPIRISKELQSHKRREKLPLIDIKEFVYDTGESCKLLIEICHLAEEANPKLADASKILLKAANSTIMPEIFFEAVLNRDERVFEELSLQFGTDKQVLKFFSYNSIKPSICVCAEQLANYLSGNVSCLKGYCPICGSAPILSLFEQEGRRRLICSFCWHQWHAKRLYCPYCNNSQSRDLHYFYDEEEKEARVDLCNKCKKYIKTIDTRKIDRLIYPPLEHISRLHLDIKAKEMLFTPGSEPYI